MSEPKSEVDAIDLAQSLIRCPSVTPVDAGALDVLQVALEKLGFSCTRLPFSEGGTPDVDNLYARLGTDQPNICFAGHTDVVPVGDEGAWSVDPFGAEVRDGILFGRGASDMKGAIAAFVAAVSRFVAGRQGKFDGSISFLITGDEEGPSINGTKKMLSWLADKGETLDHCLVGEPTNPKVLGDMVKIGRRGSLNAWLTVHGVQGHVAYPDLVDNPIPKLMEILGRWTAKPLDQGNEHFQPSNLEIVSIDVGNRAPNVIPAQAHAVINIRFNNKHTAADLKDWLRQECDAVMGSQPKSYDLRVEWSGDAFVTEPGVFSSLIVDAVSKQSGKTPVLSTSGGTSDARFIKNVCPVAEFGLIGATMHKVDEHVTVKDIENLRDIYGLVLEGYFPS